MRDDAPSRNGRRFAGRTGHVHMIRPDERVVLTAFADEVGAMTIELGFDEIDVTWPEPPNDLILGRPRSWWFGP